eukprot:TRINITY_DN3664_c0_g1_i1.p1 TRINITY_DN3664_c0_g1~~TRINITY_DN3664_c0_g1_i1.p1  ORF type:complete len:375 (+),score=73.94 TRINITY_DN3664_c0_g1_i1:150-1274(+)
MAAANGSEKSQAGGSYTPLAEEKSGVRELESAGNDADEKEAVELDIPEDAYGASILTIVKDFPVILGLNGPCTAEAVLGAIFAITCLAINLFLQMSLLFFVNDFVVTPSVRTVQAQFRDYRAQMYDEHQNFQHEVWLDMDSEEKASLCQIGMTNPLFYYIVLFLWTLNPLGEFRTSQRLLFNIYYDIPPVNHANEMVEHNKEEKKVYVKGLTRSCRWLLIIIVCVPKFVICITLLGLGCSWLSATTSFQDLVMNTVAMEFVTRIDEMLYTTLLPASMQNAVAEINFLVYKKIAKGPDWNGFKRSGVYFAAAVLFVVFYASFIQEVLPANLADLKLHCKEYVESQPPICHTHEMFSFPTKESILKCFPYGGFHQD